ncbi:MAG: hypothetical protein AAGK32_03380 [Actinomycetota bacterium]
MRRLLLVGAVAAVAVAARRHLVHLLTRTTGTWVGTPPDTTR